VEGTKNTVTDDVTFVFRHRPSDKGEPHRDQIGAQPQRSRSARHRGHKEFTDGATITGGGLRDALQ
jgi:hypothetical protein